MSEGQWYSAHASEGLLHSDVLIKESSVHVQEAC